MLHEQWSSGFHRGEIGGKVTQAPHKDKFAADPGVWPNSWRVRFRFVYSISFSNPESSLGGVMSSDRTKVGVLPVPDDGNQDLDGKTDLQRRIIVVYVVMTVFSSMVLGLRLYTRIFIRRLTGLDDVLVVLSWLGCVAWLVICFEGTIHGTHSSTITDIL